MERITLAPMKCTTQLFSRGAFGALQKLIVQEGPRCMLRDTSFYAESRVDGLTRRLEQVVHLPG